LAQDCIFCKIGGGEIQSDILYRNDNCFVIRDIAPKAPVHLLVIPNQHFTFLTDLTPKHYPMIGDMIEVAEEMARQEGLGESGYRLVINQGKDAGQQVDHLHVHVLGGKPLAGMA
jgi:histidine triad (HIT) family protein